MEFIKESAIMALKPSLEAKLNENFNNKLMTIKDKTLIESNKKIDSIINEKQIILDKNNVLIEEQKVKINLLKEKATKTIKEVKELKKVNASLINENYMYKQLSKCTLSENSRLYVIDKLSQKVFLNEKEFSKELNNIIDYLSNAPEIKEKKSPLKEKEVFNQVIHSKEESEIYSLIGDVSKFMNDFI
jgi:hypothetical protein